MSLEIGRMQPAEARAVAQLHADGINQGFLVRLGVPFLRQLYLGIARAEGAAVFVVRRGGEILGFCAYARHVPTVYKQVLRQRWFRLGWAALPRLLRPTMVKECLDTLRYPKKQAASHLPPAEVLSIAIRADARGLGVGRGLIEAVVAQARGDGEPTIKALAGDILPAANQFYVRSGFKVAGQLTQHGRALNVYVRDLRDPSVAPSAPENGARSPSANPLDSGA